MVTVSEINLRTVDGGGWWWTVSTTRNSHASRSQIAGSGYAMTLIGAWLAARKVSPRSRN